LLFALNANNVSQETTLIDAAVAWLNERLPTSWTVERSRLNVVDGYSQESVPLDGAIDIRASNGVMATIPVEARRSFEPREVATLLPGMARQLRRLAGNVPLLVVAPWLSERTRALLAAENINSLDLTGNARILLENPTVYIESVGSSRNPDPEKRGPARIRGPKAARLVRLLADVRPPYGVVEIARAAQLTPGYVSRLLDAMDREALIERSRRGQVLDVDFLALLRRWADSYDVYRTNETETFLAPNGIESALAELEQPAHSSHVAVTGSLAAVRLAPIAAPALLTVYCLDPSRLASSLGVLPADTGGNVALLRPFDPVVWARMASAGGIRYVAASQAAVDCLTGTGRMPSEGEAVLAWMADNEAQWRAGSLQPAST
jgi:hypothetical protein